MLDVQCRIDVDAVRQQFLHIHVAFRVSAAGSIGMRQLIDQNEARPAGEDGVDVHLLEMMTLVVDRVRAG